MPDLRSWRLPVAIVLLVALTVRVGAALIALIDGAVAGLDPLLYLASAGVGPGEVVVAIGLAAMCWWAAADDVPGIRVVAGIGAALVAVQVLLTGAAAVATFALGGGALGMRLASLLAQLTWLVVPVVTVVVLLRVARSAGEKEPVAEVGPGDQAPAGQAPAEIEAPEVVQPYREAAGWAPDEAAGAVWTSAGEAAKGAAASGWGSSASAGTDWGSLEGEPPASDSRPQSD